MTTGAADQWMCLRRRIPRTMSLHIRSVGTKTNPTVQVRPMTHRVRQPYLGGRPVVVKPRKHPRIQPDEVRPKASEFGTVRIKRRANRDVIGVDHKARPIEAERRDLKALFIQFGGRAARG